MNDIRRQIGTVIAIVGGVLTIIALVYFINLPLQIIFPLFRRSHSAGDFLLTFGLAALTAVPVFVALIILTIGLTIRRKGMPPPSTAEGPEKPETALAKLELDPNVTTWFLEALRKNTHVQFLRKHAVPLLYFAGLSVLLCLPLIVSVRLEDLLFEPTVRRYVKLAAEAAFPGFCILSFWLAALLLNDRSVAKEKPRPRRLYAERALLIAGIYAFGAAVTYCAAAYVGVFSNRFLAIVLFKAFLSGCMGTGLCWLSRHLKKERHLKGSQTKGRLRGSE